MRMRWKTLTPIILSTFSVIPIRTSKLKLRSPRKNKDIPTRPSSVMIQKPIGKVESTSSNEPIIVNSVTLMPVFVKVIEHFSDSVIIEYIHYDVVSVIFANDPPQYSRARAGGGILSSLLSRSSPQTVIRDAVTDGDIKRLKMEDETSERTRTRTQEPCGHQCKLIKQVTMIYERQLRRRQRTDVD